MAIQTATVADTCAAAKHASRVLARTDSATRDAALLALAEALEAPLVTTDERLARVPGVRAVILTP